jgi:glutathione synthase
MRQLFLMDPIASVRIDQDSTFALMCEAQARGHEVLYGLADDLHWMGDRVSATVSRASLKPVQGQHASLESLGEVNLADVDVVWMRKDPPFDMSYIFTTYILDRVADTTLVVNHPDGLRAMNEKAWITGFPELIPPTMITQDVSRLRDWAEDFGAIVVKPLDGNGGAGVFVVRQDDPNIGVILEMSTVDGTRKVMAQEYLAAAKAGDKRVILVDGRPAGAILRVPKGVDHRGNIHVGAEVIRAELTEQERHVCEVIGPLLRDAGQVFTGIDLIGERLTEVNVTSPTGIHEINVFDDVCIEAELMDAVMARLARGA